jgi:hypothetical protein
VRLLADAFGLTGTDRDRFVGAGLCGEPDQPDSSAADDRGTGPGRSQAAAPAAHPWVDVVPAQLPPDVAGFAGRANALAHGARTLKRLWHRFRDERRRTEVQEGLPVPPA